MKIDLVIPWQTPGWDEYVRSHPGSTVYHTSLWSRIVCESAGYTPCGFVARRGGTVAGLLPAAEVKSRLTGPRLVTLPFSDECFAISEDEETAHTLVETAAHHCRARRLGRYELRGRSRLRNGSHVSPQTGTSREFSEDTHFSNFVIPLSADPEAVRQTFGRKAVRQTINKAIKSGVSVREGGGEGDIDAFYHLYALNRRRHGIPPQPRSFFVRMLADMAGEARARLYVADFESRPAAALITFSYRDVTWAKYEGVDAGMRRVLPVYPLMWKAIESACIAGHRSYDFGRTADDNAGLCAFKSRWGTERTAMPYFHTPPSEAISTVRADSLKYRLFTGVFRRMPLRLFCAAGGRLFRHFG